MWHNHLKSPFANNTSAHGAFQRRDHHCHLGTAIPNFHMSRSKVEEDFIEGLMDNVIDSLTLLLCCSDAPAIDAAPVFLARRLRSLPSVQLVAAAAVADAVAVVFAMMKRE